MRREKARIENPVVRRALAELLVPSIPLKLVRGSETGKPDQLFLIPGGRPLFIELKWPGQPPDPKQEYWHGVLKSLGYEVQVHESAQAALKAIATEVVAAALYAEGGEVPPRTWRSGSVLRSRLAQNKHYARSIQFLEKAKSRK